MQLQYVMHAALAPESGGPVSGRASAAASFVVPESCSTWPELEPPLLVDPPELVDPPLLVLAGGSVESEHAANAVMMEAHVMRMAIRMHVALASGGACVKTPRRVTSAGGRVGAGTRNGL